MSQAVLAASAMASHQGELAAVRLLMRGGGVHGILGRCTPPATGHGIAVSATVAAGGEARGAGVMR